MRVRARASPVPERLTLGDRVLIPTRLEPGQSTRVDYGGSSWTARNIGEGAIAAGVEAVIVEVEGLTLRVRASA